MQFIEYTQNDPQYLKMFLEYSQYLQIFLNYLLISLNIQGIFVLVYRPQNSLRCMQFIEYTYRATPRIILNSYQYYISIIFQLPFFRSLVFAFSQHLVDVAFGSCVMALLHLVRVKRRSITFVNFNGPNATLRNLKKWFHHLSFYFHHL